MMEAIPKWVMQRYSALYRKFKMKQFTREEVKKTLEEFGIDSEQKLTNTFFSYLNKCGWVEIERDKEDSRKKLFKLIPPEKAILNLNLGEIK